MNILSKKYFFIFLAFLFFSLIFVPLSAKVTESLEQAKLKEFRSQYPSTSTFYRGVVAIDANNGGSDEIYCDFGSNGIWVYTGSWTRINSSNPEWMFGFNHGGTDYLVADFGSVGLWRWNYNGSWTGTWVKISNSNAGSGFATDDDNDGDQELHINFAGLGLWRYDLGDATKWVRINSLTSERYSLRMDTYLFGYEEGAHDFGGSVGLWRNYGTTSWEKLNSTSPEDDNVSARFTDATDGEDLVCDFYTLGVWLCDEDDHSWHKLAASDPCDLVAVKFPGVADYEMLAAFCDVPGLWLWDYSGSYPGTWTRINATDADWDEGFCEPFDPDYDTWDEAAVDFGSLGLWQYEHTGAVWTKINSSNPSFMVACDYYGDLVNTTLVVDFGSLGLWLYDGVLESWYKLNSLSPDGVN